jgi:hypothetical protein
VKAVYRLSHDIASFEFFSWLVMVKAAGAKKIIFDISNPKTNKFSHESVMRRFYSIIEPGPALAQLPYRYGNDENGLRAVASQLIPWVRAGNTFPRLLTVKPAVQCEYTVTIRNNFDGARGRDSNTDAWYKFAEEIGAILIEDYFVKPIHLHDRMALYAGAKMNFGVCNGPVHIISLTPYPSMQFVNTESARNSNIRWGLQVGQNLPWMLPNQRVVWMEDSLDNLRRAMDDWLQE